MKILVLGGTRYFGISMVEELIRQGHDVTIATRQRTEDKSKSGCFSLKDSL